MTLGSHEAFVAVPAREMLNSGDWIVPRYGGLPRWQKPPLGYWLVATVSWLNGEVTEWTCRLPAAIASLLLAAVMALWAKRWYGPTAALGTALVQTTSLYVLIYARKTEVDMVLCLLTTAALFLIAQQPDDESRRNGRIRWIGVYALLGLSWLAKFHYGAVMVLAPIVLHSLIQRRYRTFWKLANPIGIGMLAASIVVWPILVLREAPGASEVWYSETVGRAVGDLGREPVWFYVPQLLGLLLPWTPLALVAVPKSWCVAWREGDARERFLWVWLLGQLFIVTAQPNKHANYILAALPMLSLLAGQGFARIAARFRDTSQALQPRAATLWFGLCVGGAVAIWWLLTRKWPYIVLPATVLSLFVGLGACVILGLAMRRKPFAATGGAVILLLACHLCVAGWIQPRVDHRLAAARFGQSVRNKLGPQKEIYVYRMHLAHHGMDPVLFYLNTPVFRVDTVDGLAGRLRPNENMMVVTYESNVSELAGVGRYQILARMIRSQLEPIPDHPPLVLLRLTAFPTVSANVDGPVGLL